LLARQINSDVNGLVCLEMSIELQLQIQSLQDVLITQIAEFNLNLVELLSTGDTSGAKFQYYNNLAAKFNFHSNKLTEFIEYGGEDVEYWMYLYILVLCLLPEPENDLNIISEFMTPNILTFASQMADREDFVDNKWIALMQVSRDLKFYYCREHYSNLEFVDSEFDKLVLPYTHVCSQQRHYSETERYSIIATPEEIESGRNIRQIESVEQFEYILKNMENCFYNADFCCMSHDLYLALE
jgi:hypothetical protein